MVQKKTFVDFPVIQDSTSERICAAELPGSLSRMPEQLVSGVKTPGVVMELLLKDRDTQPADLTQEQ